MTTDEIGDGTDLPRSYVGIAVDTVKRHSKHLYLVGFFLFSLFATVTIAVLIHIHVTEISVIATVEAQEGTTFAEQLYLPGVYFNLVLYLAASTACLYSVVNHRD